MNPEETLYHDALLCCLEAALEIISVLPKTDLILELNEILYKQCDISIKKVQDVELTNEEQVEQIWHCNQICNMILELKKNAKKKQ